jgi:hypothetical protein
MHNPLVLDKLEKEKAIFLDVLHQLQKQSKIQKSLLPQATTRQIEEFTSAKKNCQESYLKSLGNMQALIKDALLDQVFSNAGLIDSFVASLTKESQPIIQDIIKTESSDMELIQKTKQETLEEVNKIEKAMSAIKNIKTSYAAENTNQPRMFDQKG